MSDGAISQDEIEALLAGVPVDGLDNSGHVSGPSAINIDTLTLNTFAENLKQPLLDKVNSATGANFTLTNVSVTSSERDKLLAVLPEVVIAVYADFSSPVKGDHLYLLSTEFAQKIVNLITKEENADLDAMALNCISEFVTNQTDNEIQELGNTGKFADIACNSPECVNNPKAMIRMPQGNFALFTYTFNLDGKDYTFWEAVGGEVSVKISEALGGGNKADLLEVQNDSSFGMNQMNQMPNSQMQNPQMQNPQMNMQPQMQMGMNQMQPQMRNMGMQMPQMNMQPQMMNMGMQMQMPQGNGAFAVPNVQTLQYPNLQNSNILGEQGNIGLIMDVKMEMTVELGRTEKQVKDILAMGEGTILELDKLAGEAVDILVNHKLIAKGEVVVIDENFGVRVTEILSPLERVSDLR